MLKRFGVAAAATVVVSTGVLSGSGSALASTTTVSHASHAVSAVTPPAPQPSSDLLSAPLQVPTPPALPPNFKAPAPAKLPAPGTTLAKAAALKRLPPRTGAKQAFTTCSPTCFYYVTGSESPTGGADGWYAAFDVAQPTMSTANGDIHTLAELTVEDSTNGNTLEMGWNIDPSVNGGTYTPHVFTYYWVNHVPQAYNVDVTACGQPQTAAPGALITTGLKKFGIQHNGTWPSGAWWFAYDTGWTGCLPDSTLVAKGISVPFTHGNYFQAFGEVASSHDLAAGSPPCAQMGNGKKGSLTNTVSPTPARIANTTYVGVTGTTSTIPNLYMRATPAGNAYYNLGNFVSGTPPVTSTRSFYYGGDNTAC
jgi:hypothetical protein